MLDAGEQAEIADVEQRLRFVEVGELRRARDAEAGVVDEDVQRALGLLQRGERLPHARLVRYVAGDMAHAVRGRTA